MDRSVSPDGSELVGLDSDAVRRWFAGTLAALRTHRRTVNELNVFPVPDGDTGTNLMTTVAAASAACDRSPAATVPELIRMGARGALLAARGNSGVILAQVLQGLADIWTEPVVDAPSLARGLRHAADVAAEAVAEPADGTILTVAAAAARAAVAVAERGADLARVAAAATESAVDATCATIEQLPALTRAGVIDAGGVGFTIMLNELATVVTGRPSPRMDRLLARGPVRPGAVKPVPRESGSAEYEYEVQYLVDADVDAIGVLRDRLSRLGDSVVVVGAAGEGGAERTWNVHCHVNDVGAAVEAGIGAGRLHRLAVTRFDDGDIEQSVHRATAVLTASDALTSVFNAENAIAVDGPDVTAHRIVTVLRAIGARELVILAQTVHRDAAESAARRLRTDGIRVEVVPIQAPVQAVAALAVRDHDRRFEDDAIAMAEAAGSCRHAEVVRTDAPGLTTVGRCEADDYLALADGDVVFVDAQLSSVARDLVDRLCAAGAELLTLVTGPGFDDSVRTSLTEHMTRSWSLVDTQWLTVDRGDHLLWIGAE